MSFSGGTGSWTPVDMPPPSSAPVVNQTLKRADEVEIKKLTFKVNILISLHQVMASLGKARVKARASDQSWEEEEMMYEINRRNLKRQKRKLEQSKVTPEQKEEKRLERKKSQTPRRPAPKRAPVFMRSV